MSELIPVFSVEHLRSLKLGDKFQSEGLMQGVSARGMSWTVLAVTEREIELRATYFGVHLGNYTVRIAKDGSKVKLHGPA